MNCDLRNSVRNITPFFNIFETMSLFCCTHSLLGISVYKFKFKQYTKSIAKFNLNLNFLIFIHTHTNKLKLLNATKCWAFFFIFLK